MPKRCNPFGDNSTPQFKTHVREKEVNNGVCQHTRMQSVYDRTHKLLCAGMKEMQDKHISLDANENFLPQSWETLKADRSDLKQMHIDKNCQLVDHEESTLMDMETDSNSCHDTITHHSLGSNLAPLSRTADTAPSIAAGGRVEVLSSFGLTCARNPSECSHPSAVSITASAGVIPLCGDASSTAVASNAFSHMKQAQLKNSTSREPYISLADCHNCRKAVQPIAMRRCQFCETCVCCICVRQCTRCLLHFCQLCSVINYDLPTERSFCLNCAER